MAPVRKPKVKQADLAVHLDLSTRTVRDHFDKGVFSCPRDAIDLDQCRIDYIRYLRVVASGREKSEKEEGGLDPEVELALLRIEQRGVWKVKKERAEGAVIDRKDMIIAVSSAFARVKSALFMSSRKQVPRLAVMTDENEIREYLDARNREVLEELASTPVEAIGQADEDDLDLGEEDDEV